MEHPAGSVALIAQNPSGGPGLVTVIYHESFFGTTDPAATALLLQGGLVGFG